MTCVNGERVLSDHHITGPGPRINDTYKTNGLGPVSTRPNHFGAFPLLSTATRHSPQVPVIMVRRRATPAPVATETVKSPLVFSPLVLHPIVLSAQPIAPVPGPPATAASSRHRRNSRLPSRYRGTRTAEDGESFNIDDISEGSEDEDEDTPNGPQARRRQPTMPLEAHTTPVQPNIAAVPVVIAITTPNPTTQRMSPGNTAVTKVPTSADVHYFFKKVKQEDTVCTHCR